MSSTDSYQPYVEDYDSTISEVVPLTRRHTARGKSGLSNEVSSSYDAISDSGYSSTNTPNNDSPPLKSTTPAPESVSRKEAYKRSSTPGLTRPSSKAYNRISTASPAIPRNIPGAKPRERSPTTTTTGGTDECDCSDCKKETKGSPSSPSVLSGAWPLHGSYHASYSQSPTWSGGYPQYPPSSTYDSYGRSFDGSMLERGEMKSRTSMPHPPRPSSTFSGTTTSSFSTGYGNYFGQTIHSSSPAPAPPAPSSTCPPGAFSAYAPPPLNTSMAPTPDSYLYNSPSVPSYAGSYSHDTWSRSDAPPNPNSSYPTSDYISMPPPPPLNASNLGNGSSNRRNSLRSPVSAGPTFHSFDDYPKPPQRRSSRAHGERPPSWTGPSYMDTLDRSVSVPPQGTMPPESIRRKTATPGPASTRRRESGSSSGLHTGRIGPSALSRAMESCAIEDEPPSRNHSRSHSEYYSNYGPSQGQLARREPGTLMQSNNGESGSTRFGSSHRDSREELVQMTVPDSDGETFTMRYPAGIPVKLQLNGAAHRTIAFGSKDKNESVEHNIEYRYVQQRQQQVHAQLQYGAIEHGSQKPSSTDYSHRPNAYGRRATMSGA